MAGHQDVQRFGSATYSDAQVARVAAGPRRALGEIWIVYGLLHFVAAALMVVYSEIATLMFGSQLDRVPDRFTLMAIFHFCYWVMIALVVVDGVLVVFAGVALMRGQESARRLAIIAGVLALAGVPV